MDQKTNGFGKETRVQTTIGIQPNQDFAFFFIEQRNSKENTKSVTNGAIALESGSDFGASGKPSIWGSIKNRLKNCQNAPKG